VNYELLTEELSNRYNRETVLINEFGPVIGIAARVLIPMATAYGVTKHFDGAVPDWAIKLSESKTWRILSLFDPTGLMSYPYVERAWEEWNQKPDDQWAAIKYVLSLLAVIPGFGIGARGIMKLATLPFMPIKWFSKLFYFAGRSIQKNSKIMDDVFPLVIARGSTVTYKGVNQGESIRRALEKSLGVKVSDSAIKAAAKKYGITLGRVAGGAGAATAAMLGKTAGGLSKFIKPTARLSRTTTAATAGGDSNSKETESLLRKALNTPRTPAVYGPKIGFGQIGGAVQY
jgi:hypothetical protein